MLVADARLAIYAQHPHCLVAVDRERAEPEYERISDDQLYLLLGSYQRIYVPTRHAVCGRHESPCRKPPIIGALDLTVIAGYGGVFLEANANTGIVGGPPSPNIPNVVTNASVQGSAGFQDVIHFLGGAGMGFLDATVTCMCLRLDDASAIASFQLGSVNVTNADGMYIPSPFSGHMTTPFALNGSIAISISATVTATDSNPSDPLSGASFARVSAGLGGFILTNAAGMPIVVQYYSDSGDALPWFGRVRPRAGNVGTYGTIAAWSGPVAMSRLRRHGR